MDADRFSYFLSLYNLTTHSRFSSIEHLIRQGYSFGISPLSPNSTSSLPPNRIKGPEEEEAVRDKVQRMVETGKAIGSFDPKEVEEAVGPIQSSPMRPIEKSPLPGKPKRWRLIEDFSHPHGAVEEDSEAVNADIDPSLFPCSWTTFAEVAEFYRWVASHPEAKVFGADFEDGFEHLEVHPEVRHRLVVTFTDQVHVRLAAPFGLRSTPGEFGLLVDAMLWILYYWFRGKVRGINHVDDLSVVILDSSISMEEVIRFIESFGWKLNRAKTQPLSRSTIHIGCEWNLDTLVVTICDPKRIKYLEKTKELFARGDQESVSLTEIESLVGSLQYVCFVRRDLRPRLRTLYAFRAGFPHRHARHHFRHNELASLKWWITFLEQGPISTSFGETPETFEGSFSSDASNFAVGFPLKTPSIPQAYYFAYDLVPGWKLLLEAYIGNAEAWGVEMLVETLAKMGVRHRTLTLDCDNTNVVDSWQRGWSWKSKTNASLLRLLDLANKFDLFLDLSYIPTELNPADCVSRLEPPEDALPLPEEFIPSRPPGVQGGISPYATQSPLSPT
ncbi:hypothetical protein JCM11641_005148 [Rhodosporidiobolus odoratus]